MESYKSTAVYDYDPANEDELELCEGDEVLVTMCRDDGWFQGTNLESNLAGLFPGNYVEKIEGSDTKSTNYGALDDTDAAEEENFSEDEEDEKPPMPAAPRPVPVPPPAESKHDAAHAPAVAVKKKRRRGKSTLKCAYWAQNLGIFAGACALLMGAMNFVWYSGDLQFSSNWPKVNEDVTSPFCSQTVYGISQMGFFPKDGKCKPDPGDLKNGPNDFLYPKSPTDKTSPMSFEDFKEHMQTNTKPSFDIGSIRRLAGFYDANPDGTGTTFNSLGAFIGPFTMLVGLFSILLECCCNLNRPKEGCQNKCQCSYFGTAYIIVSLPMLLTAPTCLVGVMYLLAAYPHFVSSCKKEYGQDKVCCGIRSSPHRHWTDSGIFEKNVSCKSKLVSTVDGIRRGNQIGSFLILMIWIIVNLALAIERLVEMVILWRCSQFILDDKPWDVENENFIAECCRKPGDWDAWKFSEIEEGTDTSCSANIADPFSSNFRGVLDAQSSNPKLRIEVSLWIAVAKVFGQLLNFNCALIILPVARSFLRFVSNKLLNARGNLSAIIPLQKNVTFHKLVAKFVLFAAAVHTVAHFMAIADTPAVYYDNLQLSPWITGAVIIMSMFFIYPAATDVVRRAMFRVFWANHHWFIIFFGALLVHGWVFWAWLLLPMLLYLSERLARFCRGNKPIYVKRVKWIPPVLEVQFCPATKLDFSFKEGQYLFMRCPHLDTNPFASEWHPFTISSAQGDLSHKDFISCHIKIQPGGWTERLKNYFEDMNPGAEYPFELKHRDEKGELQDGKLIGIDGQQLLCIDGPHSSPSQHYDAYRRTMIIGAGIGMTPCASILRGTLLYKWKRDFYPESLYFFWTVRHNELGSFQWFVSLVTKLMTKHEMNKQAGNIGAKNNVQIHIYVTSYDAAANEARRIATLKDRGSANLRLSRMVKGTKANIGFTIDDLWEALHEPRAPPGEFLDRVCPKPGYVPDNKVGRHIYIWNGRPKWDPAFMAVGAEPGARDTDVGVCFCGASVVAKQLADCCKKFSDPDKVMFRLHKENF